MDHEAKDHDGADSGEADSGFEQAGELTGKLDGDRPEVGEDRGPDAPAELPPEPHREPARVEEIRGQIEQAAGNEPTAEAHEAEPRSTWAERHPDWPRVTMEFFFSPHSTAEDQEGLVQLLQQGGADIYLYESTIFSESYNKVLQGAANMRRPKFLKRWFKGQKAIDDYIENTTIGDDEPQPTAEAQNPNFFKKWNDRLRAAMGGKVEEGGVKGKPIIGTPIESEMRAVYGTGVVVDCIDLRPDDPVQHDQIGAEAYKTPMIVEGGFGALLREIAEQYGNMIEHQNRREEVMAGRLEKTLAKIFEQHPELKDKPDLKIVFSMGAAHAETLPPRFQELGVETTQTFSRTDHIYNYATQARTELGSGKRPEAETLARAFFEQILEIELKNRGCKDIRRYDDLALYDRQTAGAFSKDEIAAIYDQNIAGELNGAKLDEIFKQKGLPLMPSSYAEMQEMIAA